MLCLCAGVAFAQDEAPPARIDLKDFPATTVDNVIIPVPGEIFNVLDKLGSPNWKAEFRKNYSLRPGDRPHTALLLGAVIGDGFIAVQSKDQEDVRDIGRLVLELSAALGVKDAVIQHYNAIQEASDAGDWKKVREELDKTQSSVRTAMSQLGDEQLAELVSLGGWLRGTEVLTSIVGKDYSPDGADLLNQPDLVDYFEKQVDGMPKFKKHEVVTKIAVGLKEIKPLISSDKIPVESVNKINAITGGLIKLITSKEA